MNNVYQYPTLHQQFEATINLPGSKSITNRALLLAALANGKSTLHHVLDADDALSMRTALNKLGLNHRVTEETRSSSLFKTSTLHIEGMAGKILASQAHIDCADAATVLRFLLPVCAFQSGTFSFDGSVQLTKRPIQPLVEVLEQLGAEFQYLNHSHQLPFTVKGRTAAHATTHCFVPSDLSSQFLSGILMAAPLAQREILIQTENSVSEAYIDMTCRMMSKFGVMVDQVTPNLYRLKPQTYTSTSYIIEPDLSTASYFFAAAALTESTVTLSQFNRHDSLQGDAFFLDILEKMGCHVHDSSEGVTVQGTNIHSGINVDLKDCSDLFMTLACLSVFSKEASIIRGIGHIRAKESDRIAATQKNLARVGIEMKIDCLRNEVIIYPGTPHPAVLESYDDHRMVMAFALLGLKVPGISIRNAHCVTKTCPNFDKLWENMLNQFKSK